MLILDHEENLHQRIFDDMGCRISSRKGNGDNEVS